MIIRNGLVYNSETMRFDRKDIAVENGVITQLGVCKQADAQEIDAAGAMILPGLVDVHSHGRSGGDFDSADDALLSVMAKAYAANGITTVMPTIASAPLEQMYKATADLRAHKRTAGEANFCGVHIEGRYLNAAKRGAHAPELLFPLKASELDGFVGDTALHISAAFELDEDGSFAAKARELGATMSLGHTAANYVQAKQAEENGVTAYTHLYNCMPPLHHRDGGAVCAAFEGKSYGELICDGVHISSEMIRLAYRFLGCERTVLISDSMQATDCPDGDYTIAGQPVRVVDGKARTLDGALAGSTLSLFDGLKNLMRFCDIPLSEAILCATRNPCLEVGVYDTYGSIAVGKSADLIILKKSPELCIDRVMVRGELTEPVL